MATSIYFSRAAIRTFNRVGDILAPRNGDFPSFSEYGGAEHLDKVAEYTPRDDVRSLNQLMSVLAWTPTFFLRWLARRAAASHESTGPLAPLFRKLYYGWWGFIFGCYYSERPGSGFAGKDPVELINFHLNRVVD